MTLCIWPITCWRHWDAKVRGARAPTATRSLTRGDCSSKRSPARHPTLFFSRIFTGPAKACLILSNIQNALDLWRTLSERQPLTGARLIRKLVILNTRWLFETTYTQEEAEALWQEAVQLAEQAGNEDELRWVRAAYIFMVEDLRALSVEEMRQSEKV